LVNKKGWFFHKKEVKDIDYKGLLNANVLLTIDKQKKKSECA